jgi:ABC-type taurine transport system ATPase subunit
MRGKQLPMMRHGACEVSALTSSAPPSAAAPDSRYQGRSNGRSATASPPVLRVSGLVARYGDDRAAVHGLDLEIYVGEVVAPLGPNGAGTTNAQLTLAGMLSGGEQQMLTLGRTLAMKPTMLLVDELSIGLAPVVVDRLFEALVITAREDGMAVLLVEQHARACAASGRSLVSAAPRRPGCARRCRRQRSAVERRTSRKRGTRAASPPYAHK